MTKLLYPFLLLLISQISYSQQTYIIQVAISQQSPCSLGIQENVQLEKISVYPNPTSDNLIIKLDESDAVIKLIDLEGREILARQVKRGILNLNVQGLSKGLYILTIQHSKGFFRDKILIK